MDSHKNQRMTRKKDYESFLDSLRNEWKLFWAGIVGDEPVEGADLSADNQFPLKALTAEQVRNLIRTLSNDRRRIHRRLEWLNHEIEEKTRTLETIELVGGEKEATLKEIEKLSDLGLQISSELERLNQRLKDARRSQDKDTGV